MTCEDVRERLPEHVLGTLEGPEDLELRRHLRGCATCRAEMFALGEGMSLFARVAHERRPPAELRDRVLTVLDEEWRVAPAKARRRFGWIPAAAAVVLLAATLAWGVSAGQRADRLAADAQSYRNILDVLGGRDFRIGTLKAAGAQTVQGNAIVYDAHTDQSWALVLVHAPGFSGTAYATLSSPTGDEIRLRDLSFDANGDATTWLVSVADLKPFYRLTITTPYGAPLATADILSV